MNNECPMSVLWSVSMKGKSLYILIAVCAVAVLGMILALTLDGRQEIEKPAFTPPPFEVSAVVGAPDVPAGMGYSEFDAKLFKASVCGEVNVVDGLADIYLTNPESNTAWIKLRVLDGKGNILGETGLIKPGEYVKSVAFTSVPESGVKIVLKIMAYEPNTYHSAGSASLNTVLGG